MEMNRRRMLQAVIPRSFVSITFAFLFLGPFQLGAVEKRLPMKGEVFAIEDRPTFLILPEKPKPGPIPWVLYAPTLRGLPGGAEKWMFERFLKAGIAIAGVDVGESYGSPKGRAVYSSLHEHLVTKRGLSKQACLLARSRGGLMLYCWAAENPEKGTLHHRHLPGLAISPVIPGLKRACGAYGLTSVELEAQLAKHNPIDRLAAHWPRRRCPSFTSTATRTELCRWTRIQPSSRSATTSWAAP